MRLRICFSFIEGFLVFRMGFSIRGVFISKDMSKELSFFFLERKVVKGGFSFLGGWVGFRFCLIVY